ncbi:MAG: hypothetical protein ACOYMW_16355 [Candidatus Competibacteraceae bacterium]
MYAEQQSIAVVEPGGLVRVRTDRPAGVRVRVIVLEVGESIPDTALAMARLQEGSGFARAALADPAEDVWNDL